LISDEALILIAVAGICGVPIMTAVLCFLMVWLLKRLGYRVQ